MSICGNNTTEFKMKDTYYVYILANQRRTVLYIGVTNDLSRRLAEHRAGTQTSFVSRYNVTSLIYVEAFESAVDAIAREKQLKGWRREKKLRLVLKTNRAMRDLSDNWV